MGVFFVRWIKIPLPLLILHFRSLTSLLNSSLTYQQKVGPRDFNRQFATLWVAVGFLWKGGCQQLSTLDRLLLPLLCHDEYNPFYGPRFFSFPAWQVKILTWFNHISIEQHDGVISNYSLFGEATFLKPLGGKIQKLSWVQHSAIMKHDCCW